MGAGSAGLGRLAETLGREGLFRFAAGTSLAQCNCGGPTGRLAGPGGWAQAACESVRAANTVAIDSFLDLRVTASWASVGSDE